MTTTTNGRGEGTAPPSSPSPSLRDLESYQLGRGVVVLEEDRVDRRRACRSSPIERSSLLVDDDDDDREEAGENGEFDDEEDDDDGADDRRGGNMGPRSRWRRWRWRCAVLSVGASLAVAVAAASSSARGRATGVVPVTSSYWGRDSTTSSCPAATARASYSVSSEIMDLRNSSTGTFRESTGRISMQASSPPSTSFYPLLRRSPRFFTFIVSIHPRSLDSMTTTTTTTNGRPYERKRSSSSLSPNR